MRTTEGGWSTDRPARRFSGAPPFRIWFFPACRRQERVGPSAVQLLTSELVPWSCPPPPPRPSSPISPCKSPHRCPPVDRLLPPPSRQNNPAQPPRVLFLFRVTQAGKNRTTSCLPFVMLKCPLFQPQRRSAITLDRKFERACRAGRLAPSPPGLESRRPWSRPGSLRPPLRLLRLRSPRLSRRLQSRR